MKRVEELKKVQSIAGQVKPLQDRIVLQTDQMGRKKVGIDKTTKQI